MKKFDYKTKEELIEDLRSISRDYDDLKQSFSKLNSENSKNKKELTVRKKELQAVYKLSFMIKQPEFTLSEILDEAIDIISKGGDYQEITCARIILEGKEYRTAAFKASGWKQSEEILINGKPSGQIEVFYQKQKPDEYKGLLFKEEKNLLKIIAGELSRIIEKKYLEEKFSVSFQKSPVAKCLVDIDDNYRFLDVNAKFLQITGFIKDEIVGNTLEEVNFLTKEKIYSKIVKEISKKGRLENLEFDYPGRKGGFRTGLINIQVIQLRAKNLAIVTVTDITEVKLAAEKLKEREEFNSNLLNTIPYGMDIVSEAGEILFANGNLKEQFGEDIEGEKCWNIHRIDKKQCGGCPLKTGIDLGKTRTYEMSGVIGNKTFNVSHTGIMFKGEKAVLEIFNDITAQKEGEQKLRDNQRKLQSIVQNLQDAYFQVDLSLKFRYANPSAVKMFGYGSVEELVGMHTSIVYAELKDREAVAMELMEKGKIRNWVCQGIRKDKTRFWMSMNIQFLRDDDGNITGSEGVIHDITELKRKEEELIEAKEIAEENEVRFKAIFQQATDGITLVDINGNYLLVNPAFCKITGYTEKELLKMSIADLLSPDERIDLFEKVKYKGTGRREDISLQIKDKTTIYTDVNAKLIRIGSNRVVLGIVRDVTELVKRDRELLIAKEKAEESDRLKSAFLLNVSHEIRTPMNGILGFINLLSQPNLNEIEKSNFIDVVNKSGERLLNTINDIVEISRIEAGDINIVFQEINISEIMQYYYDFFRLQAEQKGVKLAVNEQVTGESAIIKTDKHKLDGILMNLIKNAIKFTNEGVIEFGNYIDTGKLYFYVRDTGIGIPEDKLDTIFDRFVQGEVKLRRNYEGLGIGLSIIKAYIEALKGDIRVKSEVGKGSIFTFAIPYSPVEHVFSETAKVEIIELTSVKSTILIVEDEKVNFQLLERLLSKEYKLVHAENGEDAIRLFKENPDISLILMDIKMPGKYDGLEATQIIRQFDKEIPIIAQTAYARSNDRTKAIKAGCNDYITKPFKPGQLESLVRKYCLQKEN